MQKGKKMSAVGSKYSKFIVLIILVLSTFAPADITETIPGLNTINDPGNPSDGLRYVDLSYSVNRTLGDAISNANTLLSLTNVRQATPAEHDDLFAAAGIIFNDNNLTLADTFIHTGPDTVLSDGDNYNSSLISILGPTNPNAFRADIWTIPDGDGSSFLTWDELVLLGAGATIFQTSGVPPAMYSGWLLVSEPQIVPVPGAVLLGMIGLSVVGVKLRKYV